MLSSNANQQAGRPILTDEEFKEQLLFVHNEAENAFILYQTIGTIDRLSRTPEIRPALDADGHFWNTFTYTHQSQMCMILHRITDDAGEAYTIRKLMNNVLGNQRLFTREEYGKRRRPPGPKPPYWDELIEDAWEPTTEALRPLKRELERHIDEYQKIYRELRNNIHAHNFIVNETKYLALFKETNHIELGKTVKYFYQLVHAIRDLYQNATKITLDDEWYAEREKTERALVERVLRQVAHGHAASNA